LTVVGETVAYCEFRPTILFWYLVARPRLVSKAAVEGAITTDQWVIGSSNSDESNGSEVRLMGQGLWSIDPPAQKRSIIY